VILLVGCAGNCPTAKRGVEAPAGHDYSFAFLLAGERAGEVDETATAEASAGHRAHIDEMGAEGFLLLAGPFGEPRVNDRWKGIYVFDSPDLDKAHELAKADPAVVAGVFDMELVPWRSDTDLGPMRARLEREKAAGSPFVPAHYVLAIATLEGRGRGAARHLEGSGRIICSGEFGGAREGQSVLFLNADSVEEAKAWLDLGDPQVSWELSSLWATSLLGDLAEAN
jgi:uncharacterized protein YciI